MLSKTVQWSLRGCVIVGAVLVAEPALAKGAPTARKASVGGGLRYGAEMREENIGPWGFGFGIKTGYTLGFNLYLGGGFEYFLGDSEYRAFLGETTTLKLNVWQVFGEVGYDVGLADILVLRPKTTIGFTSWNVEGCFEGCETQSKSYPLLAPGVEFLLLAKPFWVGPEGRYDFVLYDNGQDKTANAIVLGVSGGWHF